MCHCFDAPNWHGGCGIRGCAGGNPEIAGGIAAYRQWPRTIPRAYPFLGTAPAGDAAMDNPTPTSREALEIAGKKLETTTVKSAQPEVAPVLKLDTVGRANRAY